jgi:hypothetical protein
LKLKKAIAVEYSRKFQEQRMEGRISAKEGRPCYKEPVEENMMMMKGKTGNLFRGEEAIDRKMDIIYLYISRTCSEPTE